MAKYRVTMRDGDKYKGDTVQQQGSFVVIMNGKKEVRVPSSDIEKIETDDKSNIGTIIAGLAMVSLTGFWV